MASQVRDASAEAGIPFLGSERFVINIKRKDNLFFLKRLDHV